MAVSSAVLAARDVNPEIFAVGGLEDELVEVGIMLEPVEPTSGHLHIGMLAVIVPASVAG